METIVVDNEVWVKPSKLEEPLDSSVKWQIRAREAEARLETLELVVSYARDLVDMWPTITLRTLWKATTKIADLKEALSLVK